MQRVPVASSNLKAIGYDPATQKLEVEFKSGGVFCYDNVSPQEHQDLIGASSIGSHFHQNIRNSKPCSRV
jgi:hypothetical protein